MRNTLAKERLNLSISTRTKARIDELIDLTDAGSAAEVIKNALMTYEALAKRVDGGDLFHVEREGVFAPLDLMIDVPGRKVSPPKLRIVESAGDSEAKAVSG